MNKMAKKFMLMTATAIIVAALAAGCGKAAVTNSAGEQKPEQAQDQVQTQTEDQNPAPKQESKAGSGGGSAGNSQDGQKPPDGQRHDLTQDDNFIKEAAEVLGMTADELKSELQSGKKLDQVVTEHGMTVEQFREKMPRPQQPPGNGQGAAKAGDNTGGAAN